MAEQAVKDYARATPDLRVGILRYFNVFGSDPQGRVGELPRADLRHHSRISGACFDAALGFIPHIKVMGTKFPTKDGCGPRLRSALPSAHLAALYISLSHRLCPAHRLMRSDLGGLRPAAIVGPRHCPVRCASVWRHILSRTAPLSSVSGRASATTFTSRTSLTRTSPCCRSWRTRRCCTTWGRGRGCR